MPAALAQSSHVPPCERQRLGVGLRAQIPELAHGR